MDFNSWALIISFFSIIIFVLAYFIERRSLWIGFLFNVAIGINGILFAIFALQQYDTGKQPIFLIILTVLITPVILILLFGIYALIGLCFWNARIVIRREGKSLSNLLTLFIAIGLTIIVIWNIFHPQKYFPAEVNTFLASFSLIGFYYFIDAADFLAASFIYQFNHPNLKQNYIIVLGSGLIDGYKISPLLASRIEKAIGFYQKQAKKGTPPKIIFSGGKGDDEHLSEALAMQQYALTRGIPEKDTILEDHSVNTHQNMLFSKKIMGTQQNGQKYHAIFATNSFHLFRAGLYARKVGLKAQGIGAKTALYFLPNAIIREYIAVILMHKKRHFIIIGCILLLGIFLAVIEHYFVV